MRFLKYTLLLLLIPVFLVASEAVTPPPASTNTPVKDGRSHRDYSVASDSGSQRAVTPPASTQVPVKDGRSHRDYSAAPARNGGPRAAKPYPDEKTEKVYYKFSGAWLPDVDPALIGPENFRMLKNMRYTDGAIEGVQGYSKVSTPVLGWGYLFFRSGAQLQTSRTTPSYTLVQAYVSGLSASRVFQNQTDIPDQGAFDTTALHIDATGAGLGRFSVAPGGNIAYSNGKESYIWAGDEMRVGAFFTSDDSSGTNPKDKTEEINNTLTDTDNLATFDATQRNAIILSVRPLKGIRMVVKSANTTNATMAVSTYNGSAFTAVSDLVDGTSSGGKTLAKTGTISFATTVGTSKPYHFEGYYLYAYLLTLSDGAATVSHASLDAPWQPIGDVWDGVARQPIAFHMSYSSEYEDYTLAVNESSVIDYPVGGILDGLQNTDHVEVMFEDSMAAIRMQLLGSMVNATPSTVTIEYWDGDSYETVGTVTDGTDNSGYTLGKSGLISWNPPSDEEPKTQFGVTGYAYRFIPSETLTGTHGDATEEVLVDIVTGIPAQLSIQPFDFPSMYKNRLLLCSFSAGNEGNRVDFSETDAPDVWNGEESSMNGFQSLYFGGVAPLTCGVQLYNRYGSTVFTAWVALKKSEMYMLTGDSPDDWRIHPISYVVGCPAPLTLATAEVGFEIAKDARRNLIIWLSFSGPYAFDGAVLYPLKGINKYFDPNESVCINWDSIDKARGWYDATFREYNLLIPSGSGRITNNVWLVYDLVRKKWFEKDTENAEMPQMAFPVMDENGVQYIYAGIDTGYIMRLENSNSWDGTGITQEVITGDFWPTHNVWNKTRLRALKVAAQRIDESHSLEAQYYSDTDEHTGLIFSSIENGFDDIDDDDFEHIGGTILFLSLGAGSERLARITEQIDELAWSHAFGFKVTTSDTTKGFRPILWGIKYRHERDDE